MRILGVLLIVLGIIGLAYGGFAWTRPEKVVDLGPVHVSHEKTNYFPVPPIAGAICLVAGVLLLVPGRRLS